MVKNLSQDGTKIDQLTYEQMKQMYNPNWFYEFDKELDSFYIQ